MMPEHATIYNCSIRFRTLLTNGASEVELMIPWLRNFYDSAYLNAT
jgi:hypothetical protein